MGLPLWYQASTAAVFGAVFASFAAVLVERLAERRSLSGRSTCVCGRPLRWFENVPVAGWLMLGGRTRCCRARIPFWYVGLEAATAAGAAVATLAAGPIAGAGFIAAVLVASAGTGLGRRRRAPGS